MISDIVVLLSAKGYKTAVQPLHVADLSFEFDAVLRGPGSEHNLVLVLGAVDGNYKAALRRISTFNLVLERTGSRRPISLVLVAESLPADEHARFSEICRLVVTRPNSSQEALENSLRSLLPLKLPIPKGAVSEAQHALDRHLEDLRRDRVIRQLIDAARSGSDAVQAQFRSLIDAAASGPGESKL